MIIQKILKYPILSENAFDLTNNFTLTMFGIAIIVQALITLYIIYMIPMSIYALVVNDDDTDYPGRLKWFSEDTPLLVIVLFGFGIHYIIGSLAPIFYPILLSVGFLFGMMYIIKC